MGVDKPIFFWYIISIVNQRERENYELYEKFYDGSSRVCLGFL